MRVLGVSGVAGKNVRPRTLSGEQEISSLTLNILDLS